VDEHEKTAKAAKPVEAMLGFYIHFVVFVLVMVLLVVVNWLATRMSGGCSGLSSAGGLGSSHTR
jgi:hypothetical protein